ncbi:2OG-Fe(II) oxygenase [Candidatus Sororendozoicomonas aggregata]|uniref:2OG-Fe(II) oxygenase n=1 Tax=Candidatus Sororendozoicomonas aggregata TaxID=3073239 RepID=UPI002ED1C064
MDITFKSNNALVIDNVLSREEFDAIKLYLQFESYSFVHESEWNKSWRLWDGHPVSSETYITKSSKNITVSFNNKNAENSGISLISNKILEWQDIIRVWQNNKKSWDYFSSTTYLYPQGSGLGWHEDNNQYLGAYIYYAHPEWKPSWGGELCLFDQSGFDNSGYSENISAMSKKSIEMSKIKNGDIGPEFGWSLRERNISESDGIGTFIYPKPNRLILIKPTTTHSIKKVELSAGDNMRCSITGFFAKS